ncbi:hypothetical protein GCM10023347_01840 [Streptomyces chumphonensis]|uniref:Uncharacterized protein n=1 Tax=Streptomyces chumphonensis TaxID=1214925 RepID=A0A927F2Z2_9ACTN|nr:hypothetical protein [Streptomyces chumphonensis]MBD3934600.1 hypothetical protein [Streptomyces chumphonensis]
MTHPARPRMRHCPNCDGFPTVHITTGHHRPDGTRATLRVTCRTCHGTGLVRLSAPTPLASGAARD